MKRYLAFFGDNYYPDGGMGDFLSDHKSLKEAAKAILDANERKRSITTWGHVYDTVSKEIVL